MMVYDEERGGEQWAMNCFFGYLQEVYDGVDSCDGYVNLLIHLEQGTPLLSITETTPSHPNKEPFLYLDVFSDTNFK